MNVEYLIQLLENKMIVLNNSKAQAFMIGDLASITAIETEIAGVTDTLYKLRLLLDASITVGSINTNLVEAMTLAPSVITDGSLEPLSIYDITSYATDPLHEQKIAEILSTIGPMISPEEIDAYIATEATGSPVTGAMILAAAQEYNVDVRLMMAIMEQDSRYGTAGIAITTLNPGNVGNTGTSTQSYPSWEEGVMAVAAWLSRHRYAGAPVLTEDVTEEENAEEEEIVEDVETEVPEVTVPDSPATTTPDTATTTPVIEPSMPEETTPPPLPPTEIPEEATSTPPTEPLISARSSRRKRA